MFGVCTSKAVEAFCPGVNSYKTPFCEIGVGRLVSLVELCFIRNLSEQLYFDFIFIIFYIQINILMFFDVGLYEQNLTPFFLCRI